VFFKTVVVHITILQSQNPIKQKQTNMHFFRAYAMVNTDSGIFTIENYKQDCMYIKIRVRSFETIEKSFSLNYC
jgi:hypothetical protein